MKRCLNKPCSMELPPGYTAALCQACHAIGRLCFYLGVVVGAVVVGVVMILARLTSN